MNAVRSNCVNQVIIGGEVYTERGEKVEREMT